MLPLRLLGVRPGVLQLAGGNTFGCAPVRFGDVVLKVLPPYALHAAATNLKSAQATGFDQRVDLVRLHVQLLGDLGGRQEAGRSGFVSHPAILCVAVPPHGQLTRAGADNQVLPLQRCRLDPDQHLPSPVAPPP